MKSNKFIIMLLISTLSFGCNKSKNNTDKAETIPAIDLANMDTTIKPGDDFFRFANNNWLKNNPLPDEYTTYGAFAELDNKSNEQINEIITEVSADSTAQHGSITQKIRDFYNAGMDTTAIEKRGFSELIPYFKQINNIESKDELPALIAKLHREGFGGLFNASVSSDPKHAETLIMHLYQGGTSLTDRDDYFGDDEKKQDLHKTFKQHIAKMFELTGTNSELAKQKAEDIFAFEKRLAEKSLNRLERRDPEKTYNMATMDELRQMAPSFSWDTYFTKLGSPSFDSLNIGMPEFIKGLNENINITSIEVIKDYLKWKVITGSASQLSSNLDQENFNFYAKYLYGQETQRPRWKRIIGSLNGCLGEAIGQLYVEKHFPKEAKDRMIALVDNLRKSLANRIQNVDWMTDETKARAISKLNAINVKVGYPDKWRDYSKYDVTAKSYFKNIRSACIYETDRELAKLGQPIDREEWFMTPQTVNAYYSPEYNEIVFPAGILQPPFFNNDADDAVNYGGIGVVIGHEMTHGFDDEGRKYDKEGNLNDWWTETDAEQFKLRTQRLVELFNEFEVRGNKINGELTLGENIADLGGLNIAWDAYKLTDEASRDQALDGYTPAQRFFISYGTIWRNNIRDKALERRILEDVHSPAEARVNRTLFSMPHFYEAFEISPEDKLYIAPENRANIW